MADAAFNPGFPVYVYEEGMELPKEGTYYVVAGNGNWLHKDMDTVRGFIPVESIAVLPDLKANAEVECKLPKVPARQVWRIKEFFRRVVEKYRSESEVTLYYSKLKGDFKIHVPEQRVSHGGVQYRRVALSHRDDMGDYLRVGTIHSHCDFGAFHSGTDIGDEQDFDGLHVTFGHNDRDVFTISATVVVNGHRVKVDPMNVLEGIKYTGTGEEYELAEAHRDRQYDEWAEGIGQWMTMVQQYGFSGWPFRVDPDAIASGDEVVWAGDLKTVQLNTVMGEGPFEVLAASDGKVTIQTKVGLARLSEKLFKKVDS